MTVLGALCVSGVKAEQLLKWDFAGGNPSGATSIDGSSLNPHLFDPTLEVSDALTPLNTSGVSFNSWGWNHAGISLSNSEYYEFTMALAEPGWAFSLSSIDQRNLFSGLTAADPDGVTLQWAYSVGGGAFQLIAPSLHQQGSSGLTTNVNLSTISDLQNVTQSVTFRLFASASSASSPSDPGDAIGFRDISGQSYGLAVNGTVAPSAVPEPHEWAVLTGLMLGGLVWMRMRRRAQAA